MKANFGWAAALTTLGGLLGSVGCGGGASETNVPDAERQAPAESKVSQTHDDAPEPEAPAEEQTADSVGVPDECAPERQDCVPPPSFVTRLCEDVHQEVALYMFRRGTPWQRLYLRGKIEAVNASGGATVPGFLEFDEEVLVLRSRKASKDGIQVGDSSGSYDALRWNGSCVSLDGGEVTSNVPPKRKHSRVEWRWLGDDMRAALRKSDTITETYRARQKECKGATMGAVTKKCERLDNKLIDEIVSYVRETDELPQPEEKL